MADDSFEFNITKFLTEQKQLLALEKERFAVEKINLLEPDSNDVVVAGTDEGEGSSREGFAKKAKDGQNSKLVKVKENIPKNRGNDSFEEPEVECPVEKLLREGSFQRLQVKHSPEDLVKKKRPPNKPDQSGNRFQKKVPQSESVKHPEGHVKDDHLRRKRLQGEPNSAPNTPDRLEQQDEMEQWVSDTFYSYFPSFNKNQNEKKSMLSQARQADYQEYLKNIPQVTTKHQQYMEKYGHQAVQTVNEVGTNTNNSKATSTSTSSKNYLSAATATATPNVSFSPHLVVNSPAQTTFRKTVASNEPGSYMRKGSPREKLIEDLTHTDLSTILTTDTIDRRNRMLAEEESRRKLEYQKELIKQIDEKRKEVERLREKEKLEEEMLTSRLEQQLKTMQLEEELEREKQRSEKIRMANEQNHIRRLQLLSKLENDHKVFNPYDADRKTLSENGKEIYLDPSQRKPTAAAAVAGGSGPGKEKIYRYFSNSAQNPASFASSSLSSEMEYDSSSESMGQGGGHAGNRYQYCKNCRADIDRSFLPRTHRHHHHSGMTGSKIHCKTTQGEEHCLNCRKRIEKLCANCDRVMKRSVKRNLCAICLQAMENSRMQKEAQSELKRQRGKLLRSMELLDDEEEEHPRPRNTNASPTNPYKIIDIQYHESDNDHDLSVLNPVIVRNNYKKPYSVNIDKESLFHPSKKTPEPKVSVNIRNGEVFVDNKLAGTPTLHHHHHEDTDDVTTDEMDDRISKYVRHYNTLWMKRGMRKNNLKNGNVVNGGGGGLSPSMLASMATTGTGTTGAGSKLGPLPSLSPPKVYVSDRADNLKSDAMKTTEKKWDVPAVERTKVSPGSPRVLTQLGAIRKQLQLEQLQMDQTYTQTQDQHQ